MIVTSQLLIGSNALVNIEEHVLEDSLASTQHQMQINSIKETGLIVEEQTYNQDQSVEPYIPQHVDHMETNSSRATNTRGRRNRTPRSIGIVFWEPNHQYAPQEQHIDVNDKGRALETEEERKPRKR